MQLSGVVYIFWRAGGFSYPSLLRGIIRLAVAFLLMVTPMIKSPAHIASAFFSIIIALAGLPAGSRLTINAFCAMATGVIVETYLEQKT